VDNYARVNVQKRVHRDINVLKCVTTLYYHTVLRMQYGNKSSSADVASRRDVQEAAQLLTHAAVLDHDRLRGRAALRADGFHLLHDVHAIGDLTKHDMLAVQPGSLSRAQKELRTVGVLASIGH